jgi:hypothetical protein
MPNLNDLFSTCDICGGTIRPILFREAERNSNNIPTGRTRMVVSHLECDGCFRKVVIDDSYDSPYTYKIKNL